VVTGWADTDTLSTLHDLVREGLPSAAFFIDDKSSAFLGNGGDFEKMTQYVQRGMLMIACSNTLTVSRGKRHLK